MMRKLFFWIGVFVGIPALAVIAGIGYLGYKTFGLNKQGEAYANSAVEAITSRWDSHQLLSRASPALLKSLSSDQLASAFDRFSGLGALTGGESCKGYVFASASIGQPSRKTAQYACNENYQKGPATVKFALIKLDSKWMINDFEVSSSALPERSGMENNNYFYHRNPQKLPL